MAKNKRSGGGGSKPQQPREKADEPRLESAPALIPQQLREQLKNQPQLLMQVEKEFLRVSSYRSDWPPPDILSDYPPEYGSMIMEAVRARTSAAIERDDRFATGADIRMRRAQIIGFIISLASLAAAVALGVYVPGWPTTALAVPLVAIGVGGPNVARLIADRFYIQNSQRKR